MQTITRFTVVVAAVLAGIASASAALPAVVGTTLTSIEADGMEFANLVWPILLGFFGVALVMKLVKRFGNKV